MASSRGYAPQLNVVPECSSGEGLAAVFAATACSPLAFQGSMDDSNGSNHKRSLYPVFETCEETGDEDICDLDSTTPSSHHVEKKRRLSVEQVKSLEKNFEVENKLEPERKIQLAKELGLQPRQVAVWFQNRRARWKTKQLEKDYDLLKSEYDELNSNYKDLLQQKEAVDKELSRLRERLLKPKLDINNDEEDEDRKLQEQQGGGSLLRKMPAAEVEVVVNYKKEGSSSSDSDASEVLEVDSPVAPHLEAAPSMIMTSTFTDPAPTFLYFPTSEFPQHHQRGVLKVEDWPSMDDQGTLSWWDWS